MTPRFDLIEIFRVIIKKRRMIIITTIVAACLGAGFHLIHQKKYKAKCEFILSNPQIADRNNFFRTTGAGWLDYFASEDDIDRAIALAQSDMVKYGVINKLDLYHAYDLNKDKPYDREKMSGIWQKSYDVIRTEYKNMMITYEDPNPDRAAAVATEAVNMTDQSYREYYNTQKDRICAALTQKMHETDSAIAMLTDTLAHLREHYKIYDIISPARQNMMISNDIKSNGSSDFGMGVEKIQNIEAVKDQLVVDKARCLAQYNEFSTGANFKDLSFVHIITPATPPIKPAGLGGMLTVIACAFIGFFLSVLIALMSSYYTMLIAEKK